MEGRELAHVFAAILLMFVVASMGFVLKGTTNGLGMIFVFSIIVVGLPIIVKKATAYLLDASVEHEMWLVSRYGFKEKQVLKKPLAFGIILPLFFSVFRSEERR